MKRQVGGFLIAGAVAVFMAGGCASKEVVRSDEQLKPTAVKAQTVPTTPQPAKSGMDKEQTAAASTTASSKNDNSASAANLSGVENLNSALEKIYFDFDSANLSDTARTSLTSNAAYLKKNPTVKISIEGDCDERGSAEYNLALGEKRAKAAAQYLTTMGVGESRISTISYGKEKPADPGHDDAAWAKNRRDEFVLLK